MLVDELKQRIEAFKGHKIEVGDLVQPYCNVALITLVNYFIV
jgi:hypothetical protein